MLDLLLDCGRHLPILHMVLTWTSPRTWVKLQRAKHAYYITLDDAFCRALAAAHPKFGASVVAACKHLTLFDVIESGLNKMEADIEWWRHGGEVAEDDTAFEDRGVIDMYTRASIQEDALRVCEDSLIAMLCGFDVNDPQKLTGLTPLMRAVEGSQLRLCRLLLARSADVNLQSVGGATALSLALDPHCTFCMTVQSCGCPHREVAHLLLQNTDTCLPTAFANVVRLALQNIAWLPTLVDFVDLKNMAIDTKVLGPDCRSGTALSIALERRIHPVEAPLRNQTEVVKLLLDMKADLCACKIYTAWWGGAATSIHEFALLNKCEEETVTLLNSRVS
jgi:hypothetical protein